MPILPAPILTILPIFGSNVFMTFFRYGHLRLKAVRIVTLIFVSFSWGIALFEDMLQSPANRIGSGTSNAAQLKSIQEIITLVIFAIFSTLSLKGLLRWSQGIGFACIALGGFFIFHKW